jgi:hypothetical protein
VKSTTLGTRSAAATWETPVSLVTRSRALASNAASAPREIGSAASVDGARIPARTAAVMSRSASQPVSTASRPESPRLASATRAKLAAGQRRSAERAPAWMQK